MSALKPTMLTLLGLIMSTAAPAATITFDSVAPGSLPAGWTAGVTGKGTPSWAVAADTATPGKQVLLQSGEGTFPWCVLRDVKIGDGFVETRFRPLSGREDQAGGVVWRWKDGNTYYVARANALENNVSLYYTEGGRRKTLKYADAPVAPGQWHTLRAEFTGTRITVTLDGKAYIALDDAHITEAGAVGVWTKADSVTAFAAFQYEAQ